MLCLTNFSPACTNIFVNHFERKLWTVSKDQLIIFSKVLNTKTIQYSLNSRYRNQVSLFLTRKSISKTSIPFLDTEVNIKNNNLHWTIYMKETDRRKCFHINSEHPVTMKNSIPYSHVLRVKHIYSTIKNFKLYCSELNKSLSRKDINLTL